ncbi:MAG: 30S ribosomal protein S16 [bacterium]|nr:30S ribosomal protein S16 [candidate division KSB1 bacterium]MDH7559896.1 30S ribosomal protein S16 [bacterium]
MAVRLRLARAGKKKQPFYRIVAVDSRKARDGMWLERLGYYNPLTSPPLVELNEERVNYWLDCGAQPSDTVRSLLGRKGILLRRDLVKKGLEPARIEEEVKKWEVLQIERHRRIEAKEAEKRAAAAAEGEKAEPEAEPEPEAPAEAAPAEGAEEPAPEA